MNKHMTASYYCIVNWELHQLINKTHEKIFDYLKDKDYSHAFIKTKDKQKEVNQQKGLQPKGK